MKNNMYNMKIKISVIQEFKKGLSRKELSEKYEISYFLISTWIKQRETLLQAYEVAKQNRNLTNFYKMKKLGDKNRCVLGVNVEKEIDKWVIDERERGIAISNSDIQSKALELSERENIDKFLASLGWIYKFKQRHNLVTRKVTNKTSYTEQEKQKIKQEFIENNNDFFF